MKDWSTEKCYNCIFFSVICSFLFISFKISISPIFFKYCFPFLGLCALFLDFSPKYQIKYGRYFFGIFGVCILSLLCSQIFWQWENGFASYYSCNGLIPISDASGYLSGAKSLLAIGELNEFSARRPLSVLHFAFYIGIFRENLQCALLAQASVIAVVIFWSFHELTKRNGYFIAFFYAMICIGLARFFISSFMTENFGFSFGLISFILFYKYEFEKKNKWAIWGMLFLTLCMGIRPSSVLAIPFLWLYFLWKEHKNIKIIFLLCGVTLFGILCNNVLGLLFAPPEALGMNNLAHTLYGLSVGGKGWEYIFFDHPELLEIASDAKSGMMIYELFYQQFISHPEIFIKAVLREFFYSLLHLQHTVFRCVFSIPPLALSTLYILGSLLYLFKFIKGIRQFIYVILVIVATYICAPILNDGGTRVYLPVAPYFGFICIYPLCMMRHYLLSKFDVSSKKTSPLGIDFGMAIIFLLLCPLVISVFFGLTKIHSPLQKISNESDKNLHLVYINKYSGLEYSINKTKKKDIVFLLPKQLETAYAFNLFHKIKDKVKFGDQIFHGLDINSRSTGYYLITEKLLPETGWQRLEVEDLGEEVYRVIEIQSRETK